jgi:hypothetical protein
MEIAEKIFLGLRPGADARHGRTGTATALCRAVAKIARPDPLIGWNRFSAISISLNSACQMRASNHTPAKPISSPAELNACLDEYA